MMITGTERKNIQILRGIAIAAVVFIHNTPNGILQVWCRPFLNFSVGMFLFLSGRLSSASTWKPRKRIRKILIPYVLWTLFYTFLYNKNGAGAIPAQFFRCLITGTGAWVMYYVFVYCELTLLLPLIDRLAGSRLKYAGFLISPLEIVFMRLIPILTGTQAGGAVSRLMSLSCAGWFLYYYLGYLLGNGYLKNKISTGKLWMMWAVSVGLQILEGYWQLSLGISNCGTQLKLSALLTGTLCVLLADRYLPSPVRMPGTEILYVLGNHSFGIFFCHLAVMNLLQRIPGYTSGIIYPVNALAALFLTCGIIVAGSRLPGGIGKVFAFE